MGLTKDYAAEKEKIRAFLTTFYVSRPTDHGEEKLFPYTLKVTEAAERQIISIEVSLSDVAAEDEELAAAVEENARRYQSLFAEVLEELIAERLSGRDPPVRDALDAFIYQRLLMAREAAARATRDGEAPPSEADLRRRYPPELMRRFEVYFSPRRDAKALSVRDVKAAHIGKLITLRGLVIRATEVSPQATVITYTCDTCGAETYQPVSGVQFTPPTACPSADCVRSKANGRLFMQVRGSKFAKFQELRIQEHSDTMPVGAIPRSISVLVRGENTRLAAPGDSVRISGIFLPHLKSGFRAMGHGLLSEVFVEVQHIELVSRSGDGADAEATQFSEEELELVEEANFYDRLAGSLAPEIFGHEDVKKTLLLQLVGGVGRTAAGMKIRGAINVCLMGDPGVAKSQLLGWVNRLAPRSQYTTGRGSSGVGLTASVGKDPVTGEWALEGGALVLADKGICCIDEFDKMPEADRTAIHEVMEQQTISIAKAGIMTTLNARVAVLAAANPAYGRYNPRKSVEANIQLPAALLSRFDVLWLIQDKSDRDKDLSLAKHITYVHEHAKQPVRREPGKPEPFDMAFIRRFLDVAQRPQPKVPPNLADRLVNFYVELRQDARDNAASSTFTSARSVLAAIRLATAHARIHLREEVIEEDIKEACRLLNQSKASLKPSVGVRGPEKRAEDQIYAIVRGLLSDDPDALRAVDLAEARRLALAKGFDDAVFRQFCNTYQNESSLIQVTKDQIIFIN